MHHKLEGKELRIELLETAKI